MNEIAHITRIEGTGTTETFEQDNPEAILSVLAMNTFYGVLRQAERAMVVDNPYFRLDISSYRFEHREHTNQRLRTMMMAGQGYDMFIWDGIDIIPWARSGLLVDIYTLIESNPSTNMEDFFAQPLTALEIDGGVYKFPVSFGYFYVSINENLPPSIIDRFSSDTTITINELLDLYITLLDDYWEEFGDYNFIEGMALNSPDGVMFSQMGSFVDFNNRTSNINNPDFVEFLNLLKRAYEGRSLGLFTARVTSPLMSSGTRYGLSTSYAFIAETAHLSPGASFINAPHFIQGRPLTDVSGRLIIDQALMTPSTWASLVFPTAGDSTLAWEFSQHLIVAFSQAYGRALNDGYLNWGENSIATPILRDLFESHISSSFHNLYDAASFGGLLNRELREWNQVVDDAIEQLSYFNEKPMIPFFNQIPINLIMDSFEQFWNGLISAEEFAHRANNTISIWLIE